MNEKSEDAKSEIGTMILNKGYTLEDAKNLVLAAAAGMSSDLAAKSGDSIKAKIDGIDITASKTQLATAKLTQTSFGRGAVEGIQNMMRVCGEAFTAVVKTDLNLDLFLSEIHSANAEIDSKVVKLERDLVKPMTKPDRSVFEMEATVTHADALLELRAKFKERYDAWYVKTTNDNIGTKDEGSLLASFEKSEIFADFEEAKKELWYDSDLGWKRQFLIENKEYNEAVSAQANKKSELDNLKAKLKKDVILEQVVGAMQLGLGRAASKLKSAVKEYPSIVERLKTKVRLPCTGATIFDPHTSNNLSGMYEMMYQDYSKASLVIFSRMLLDWVDHSVSLERCDSFPLQVVNDADQTLKSWYQLDLWHYMNLDRFSVVMMLKSMDKDSRLREDALKELFAFIRKLEGSFGEEAYNEIADSEMPMYTYLSDWIRDEYNPAKNFDEASLSKRKGKGDKPTQQPPAAGNKNNYPRRNQLGESAASAEGAENKGGGQQKNATSVQNGGKSMDAMKLASGPYSKEVTRADWLYCVAQDGRKHLYTATSQRCPNCTGEKKHAYPACCLSKCSCGLFGHKTQDCKQNTKMGNSAMVINEGDFEEEEPR
eukprot:gene34105-42053_t